MPKILEIVLEFIELEKEKTFDIKTLKEWIENLKQFDYRCPCKNFGSYHDIDELDNCFYIDNIMDCPFDNSYFDEYYDMYINDCESCIRSKLYQEICRFLSPKFYKNLLKEKLLNGITLMKFLFTTLFIIQELDKLLIKNQTCYESEIN